MKNIFEKYYDFIVKCLEKPKGKLEGEIVEFYGVKVVKLKGDKK